MFERRHDSYGKPAHGWSLYLVDGGIIKQRYPGAYQELKDVEQLQADYSATVNLSGGQQLIIMPYDEDVPK